MAIFKSRFAIGDRVKIRYYSGTAVVVAVRFTKDKVLYDVDRDLGDEDLERELERRLAEAFWARRGPPPWGTGAWQPRHNPPGT